MVCAVQEFPQLGNILRKDLGAIQTPVYKSWGANEHIYNTMDIRYDDSAYSMAIVIQYSPGFDLTITSHSSSLIHWVTHICVSKVTRIGSDNVMSPVPRLAIIWTNAVLLSIVNCQ